MKYLILEFILYFIIVIVSTIGNIKIITSNNSNWSLIVSFLWLIITWYIFGMMSLNYYKIFQRKE